MNCIIISIYVHPEYYPPTLNAITELSKRADRVIVVTQKFVDTNWQFPSNVEVVTAIGKNIEGNKIPFKNAYSGFYRFYNLFKNVLVSSSTELIVVHDPMALACIWLLYLFGYVKAKVWYHNHDVLTNSYNGLIASIKYSLLKYIEKKAFRFISFFSLPSEDRKVHFPLDTFGGSFYYLPNFPASSFMKKNYVHKKMPKHIFKVIYQGTISKGHGLEEFISILKENILGFEIHLTLIGNISKKYKSNLLRIAREETVADKLFILNRVQYFDLSNLTKQHHLGLALHDNIGSIYSTAATASNKIYEYIALGLPVLLHDNIQYKKHLTSYKWAFFSQLSDKSIANSVKCVLKDYIEASEAAHLDFINNLNFEIAFNDSFNDISSKL